MPILITIPVLIGLIWLVRFTRQGKAMRATAQDKDAAAMMGIDVNRTISFTFVIAGALAGAAGVLFAFYFQTIRYDTGFTIGLIAFTAAVLGGIGNLAGAVLGALADRLHPGVQRRPAVDLAGTGVDRVDRLLRSSSSSSSSARRDCWASRCRKADSRWVGRPR